MSALLWRRFNGPIKLYTDDVGMGYLASKGLEYAWDSVDVDALNSIPKDIDQTEFWAGAKLFALQAESCPVAMVDTDLFVWKDVSRFCENRALVTLHREDLIDCYPPPSGLRIPEGYVFEDWMDWDVKPCNTAFAFFSDDSLKAFYTREAIRFMKGNRGRSTYASSQMVFAEQRLLAMCAHKMRIEIDTLIDDPYDKENKLFTHLWGAKGIARKSVVQRKRLEKALLLKIKEQSESIYIQLNSMFNR